MQGFDSISEGYFVRTGENLIFEVKGDIHPRDRLIAYLRYIPAEENSNKFRKIYDLTKRELYLQEHYPQYLWFSDVHGRIVQSVARDCIVEVLNPIDCISKLRFKKRKSTLEARAISLVDSLVETTGVDSGAIGITGSVLAETASSQSDIDLVVYGEKECRTLYSGLDHSFDVIPGMQHYSGNRLQQHVEFRWGNTSKQHQHVLKFLEGRKLLQGLFHDVDFFIRLVKLPSESSRAYGEEIIQYRGTHQAKCRIIDCSDSIFTPCEYEVETDLDAIRIDKIVSYRGRFTEHADIEEVVNVRGRLEHVRYARSGREYNQIVLGEDSKDFMLPV
jgi:predicted nucleotidyltransferase